MKLASLKGDRDGRLMVVNRAGDRAGLVADIASTLQHALDHWATVRPALERRAAELEAGHAHDSMVLDVHQLAAPLPRAFEWIDGSAFLSHVRLARQARGADVPASLLTDPLAYQGGGGHFMGPREPIRHLSEDFGIDFEAEVGVITDDVPMGTNAAQALAHVKLVVLLNDVTLRLLTPKELEKGFGFLVSKPATALSPLAVTPDELGDAWRDGRVHLPLLTTYNGVLFGQPNAGVDMHFSFAELIAHAAQTRDLVAGTIIGSGTVSNTDPTAGASCLVERRMREKLATGEIRTSFMHFGDRVRIEMIDRAGQSIFGAIEQTVERAL